MVNVQLIILASQGHIGLGNGAGQLQSGGLGVHLCGFGIAQRLSIGGLVTAPQVKGIGTDQFGIVSGFDFSSQRSRIKPVVGEAFV
ncbi:hypothetical protein SDC9_105271 [bioreactor metagenome]|uniref:Uncharacterized protein n=1 Tax=bioreactor metagenome TaxID=1076179 RepID=A0A645AZ37_9ZZZZ